AEEDQRAPRVRGRHRAFIVDDGVPQAVAHSRQVGGGDEDLERLEAERLLAWAGAAALPHVHAEVVVVAARRGEQRALPQRRRDLEAYRVDVERLCRLSCAVLEAD